MSLETFKSIEQIQLILVFLAPGLIVLFVRAQLVTGRRPKTTEYIVEYIIISALYFAVLWPSVEMLLATQHAVWARTVLWTLLLAITPAIIGLLLGAGIQKGWWRYLFRKMKLSFVSSYPNGWDWVFGRLSKPIYVLVTTRRRIQSCGSIRTRFVSRLDN